MSKAQRILFGLYVTSRVYTLLLVSLPLLVVRLHLCNQFWHVDKS